MYFTDDVPTSAVTGLQLNDPILQLDIGDLSARSAAAEPIPLFRLSTPSATDHPPPPPLPVASTRRYLANARDGPIHRPRPDSPTRHAQSLRAACEALSPSPIFLPSSPPLLHPPRLPRPQRPGVLVRLLEDASFRLPRAVISHYAEAKERHAIVRCCMSFSRRMGCPSARRFGMCSGSS